MEKVLILDGKNQEQKEMKAIALKDNRKSEDPFFHQAVETI
jgi:hypothetical protein